MIVNERSIQVCFCAEQDNNLGVSLEQKIEKRAKIESCAIMTLLGGEAVVSAAAGAALYVANVASPFGAAAAAGIMITCLFSATLSCYCPQGSLGESNDNIIG